jgi:hypothetical protein
MVINMDSEDLEQYTLGWQDGARGKKIPKNWKKLHPEYLKGHGDGNLSWQEARAKARIRLNEPSTSIVWDA